MQRDTIWILVLAIVVGALFAWLWRGGHLQRLADYISATREELRKCSWPSCDELKGSTMIVGISIVILGGFTMLVDQILLHVFLLLKI